MKEKFKAWVRAHSYCFGLYHLSNLFMEYNVSYGSDGYEKESPPPTPAGWYKVTIFNDDGDTVHGYLTDPDSYMDHLLECGFFFCMQEKSECY